MHGYVCGLTDTALFHTLVVKHFVFVANNSFYFLFKTLLDCKSELLLKGLSRLNSCKLHLLAECLQKISKRK